MGAHRHLATEIVVAVALGWLVFADGLGRVEDPWLTLWIAMSYLLLELFDVELPRGEASSMSAGLLALAAVYLGPSEATLAVLLPSLAVSIVRPCESETVGRVQAVLKNTLVLFVAILVWQYLAAQPGWPVLLAVSIVAAVAVLLDFGLTQLRSAVRLSTPLRGLILGSLRIQGTLSAALISSSVFGFVILDSMGFWGVVVITLLLMIMRQAFALLISVRRAYQSTMEALARTVEAQDPGKLGHAERVASLASEVGRLMGFASNDLERLSYAALLHDLGEVGSEGSPAESADPGLSAADMIRDVGFLRDVSGILRVSESPVDVAPTASADDCLLAYVVLVSSRTDDLAQGKETSEDASRISSLHSRVDEDSQKRLEMAFRSATQRLPGRLFAVADDSPVE